MRFLFLLSITLCFTPGFAQTSIFSSEVLSPQQVAELFPDSVRQALQIRFPIYRAYRYGDKAGKYFCILTESTDTITENKDTIHRAIKAINIKRSFTKLWEINDHIEADKHEHNISFWTGYSEFKDYDGDFLIEPIIVYGTLGLNGYEDGRIKFIIYYKGQKIAIRHQNGTLDRERETQVDKAFYGLPKVLQAGLKRKMELMTRNKHAIFPYGWQAAMQNRKTIINER